LNVKVLPVRLNKLLVFSIKLSVAITLTGNLNIVGNTATNTDLGTLSATDADAGDTFTYTLVNNSAAYFDGVRFCVTFKVGGDTVEC
jgi:hypothetical protein